MIDWTEQEWEEAREKTLGHLRHETGDDRPMLEDIVQHAIARMVAGTEGQTIANPQGYLLRVARRLYITEMKCWARRTHSSLEPYRFWADGGNKEVDWDQSGPPAVPGSLTDNHDPEAILIEREEMEKDADDLARWERILHKMTDMASLKTMHRQAKKRLLEKARLAYIEAEQAEGEGEVA